MRKLSTKWVQKCLNADVERQRCNSSEQIWNFFGASQMITCRDGRPWRKHGYITITRRQSNNHWSGSIVGHLAPNNSKFKNPMENFSPRFFGSRRHPPHWLPSIEPNYQRGVLLISAGATEWHFEGKLPWKVHQGVLFLHDNAPTHRALATQKKLTYLGFQTLEHLPYSPDLAPSVYHLFSGLKKQLKGRHFRPTRRSLLPRRPRWTDSFWFFLVAYKSQNNGLRCVLSFVGSMLNKSWGCKLKLVSFLVGLSFISTSS